MAQPLPDPTGAGLSEAELADGRQSAAALEIARGAARGLRARGFSSLFKLPLANGRRADIAALNEAGEIWIVEVKSSLEDFRSDQKWPQYRPFCDRLLFAVAPGFPREVLPPDTGLIVADRYGAEILREAPVHPLAGARRKAMLIRIARLASWRLQGAIDPAGW